MMPAYVYKPVRPPNRHCASVNQSIHDEPLHVDPETGEAVRRVISARAAHISGATDHRRSTQPIIAGSEV